MRNYMLTIVSMVVMMALVGPVSAQPDKIPFHKEPYFVDSGIHDGLVGPGKEATFVFGEVIQVPDAPWLRLRFHSYHPGDI